MIDKQVAAVLPQFPETFGLKAFPGDVFRINPDKSFSTYGGSPQLVLVVQRGEFWNDFSRCSPAELESINVRMK